MSDSKEVAVDVLIDEEEEAQQFKAVPIQLSEAGEKRFLSMQESYRIADHSQWNIREQKKADAQLEHIKTTNRFNLVNSVVHMFFIAVILAFVAEKF